MNDQKITLQKINSRYSSLAESSCCLSCGGAINHCDIKPGDVCADLGSGRGNDVMRLADLAGESGFAYGIDMSDGMLEKARKSAHKFGIKNVDFIRSELEELKLENDSIDVLISNCTLNHADDKDLVWKEIFRVMKNGGQFVVSDIYSTETVPEKYRNDPQAVAECWAGAVTRGEYIGTLKNAGFPDFEIIEESDPYPKGEIHVSSWTIKGIKRL